MLFILFFLTFFIPTNQLFHYAVPEEGDYYHLYSKVCISARIFDYDHSLSYFLGSLEEIRYPKDVIKIMFFLNTSFSANDLIFFNLKKYKNIFN